MSPVHDVGDERDAVALRIEALPRQHLVERRAHRVHVGARVERALCELLGRHVRDLALHDADDGAHVAERALGDAEVRDLHLALDRHEDVTGRDVAMDHAEGRAVLVGAAMRVVQALERLDRDAHGVGGREPRCARVAARAEEATEVEPLDELHREEPSLVDLPEVERAHDVRVCEPHRDAGLVHEEPREVRVARVLGSQELERDDALDAREERDARAEHLSHPARAERFFDAISRDRRVAHGSSATGAIASRTKKRCPLVTAKRCVVSAALGQRTSTSASHAAARPKVSVRSSCIP